MKRIFCMLLCLGLSFMSVHADESIRFEHQADQFIFIMPTKDEQAIFTRWTQLLPGEQREQKIHLTNEVEEQVDFSVGFRTQSLQDKSILKYLHLSVSVDKQAKLYEGKASEVDGLQALSLGSLSKGGQATLVMTLKVDENAPNQLQEAVANLNWYFDAQVHSDTPVQPKNNDQIGTGLFLATYPYFGIGLFALGGYLWLSKRHEKESKD